MQGKNPQAKSPPSRFTKGVWMFRRIHEKLGTAGFVLSIVALVAAMSGGAYAALSGADKQFVKTQAKKYAKQFAKEGPQGPKGDIGPKGDVGAAGKNGADGANGISPTGTAFSGAEGGCTEGGVKFVGANTAYACNGVKGADGQTGFVETLPPGKTVMGTWLVEAVPNAELPADPAVKRRQVEISLVLPLASTPPATALNVIKADGVTAWRGSKENCDGTKANPLADPGHLCLYVSAETNIKEVGSAGTNERFKSGMIVTFQFQKGAPPFDTLDGLAMGSWAWTAPAS